MKPKFVRKASHRHRWEQLGESCHQCGAWVEVCTKCYAEKDIDGNGKVISINR